MVGGSGRDVDLQEEERKRGRKKRGQYKREKVNSRKI
jgi:hypothetical protein